MLGRLDHATNPIGVAEIYFALGDKDEGFKWLSKAIDQRQGFARWLNVSPLYDDFARTRGSRLSWPASSSRLRTFPLDLLPQLEPPLDLLLESAIGRLVVRLPGQ